MDEVREATELNDNDFHTHFDEEGVEFKFQLAQRLFERLSRHASSQTVSRHASTTAGAPSRKRGAAKVYSGAAAGMSLDAADNANHIDHMQREERMLSLEDIGAALLSDLQPPQKQPQRAPSPANAPCPTGTEKAGTGSETKSEKQDVVTAAVTAKPALPMPGQRLERQESEERCEGPREDRGSAELNSAAEKLLDVEEQVSREPDQETLQQEGQENASEREASKDAPALSDVLPVEQIQGETKAPDVHHTLTASIAAAPELRSALDNHEAEGGEVLSVANSKASDVVVRSPAAIDSHDRKKCGEEVEYTEEVEEADERMVESFFGDSEGARATAPAALVLSELSLSVRPLTAEKNVGRIQQLLEYAQDHPANALNLCNVFIRTYLASVSDNFAERLAMTKAESAPTQADLDRGFEMYKSDCVVLRRLLVILGILAADSKVILSLIISGPPNSNMQSPTAMEGQGTASKVTCSLSPTCALLLKCLEVLPFDAVRLVPKIPQAEKPPVQGPLISGGLTIAALADKTTRENGNTPPASGGSGAFHIADFQASSRMISSLSGRATSNLMPDDSLHRGMQQEAEKSLSRSKAAIHRTESSRTEEEPPSSLSAMMRDTSSQPPSIRKDAHAAAFFDSSAAQTSKGVPVMTPKAKQGDAQQGGAELKETSAHVVEAALNTFAIMARQEAVHGMVHQGASCLIVTYFAAIRSAEQAHRHSRRVQLAFCELILSVLSGERYILPNYKRATAGGKNSVRGYPNRKIVSSVLVIMDAKFYEDVAMQPEDIQDPLVDDTRMERARASEPSLEQLELEFLRDEKGSCASATLVQRRTQLAAAGLLEVLSAMVCDFMQNSSVKTVRNVPGLSVMTGVGFFQYFMEMIILSVAFLCVRSAVYGCPTAAKRAGAAALPANIAKVMSYYVSVIPHKDPSLASKSVHSMNKTSTFKGEEEFSTLLSDVLSAGVDALDALLLFDGSTATVTQIARAPKAALVVLQSGDSILRGQSGLRSRHVFLHSRIMGKIMESHHEKTLKVLSTDGLASLALLVARLAEFVRTPAIVVSGASMLRHLMYSSSGRKISLEIDGLRYIFDAIVVNDDHLGVVVRCLLALANASYKNTVNQIWWGKQGGINLVMNCMERNTASFQCQLHGTRALRNLTSNEEYNVRLGGEIGLIGCIHASMIAFPDELEFIEEAVGVLLNFSASEVNCQRMIDAGVTTAVKHARTKLTGEDADRAQCLLDILNEYMVRAYGVGAEGDSGGGTFAKIRSLAHRLRSEKLERSSSKSQSAFAFRERTVSGGSGFGGRSGSAGSTSVNGADLLPNSNTDPEASAPKSLWRGFIRSFSRDRRNSTSTDHE
ncbi:hypothetical protein FVE85_7489 [Porphyridium purpureum]|uniref:Protein aardvark n=1 Tax=Porphyridium purpureum TaxID=35688 RepID=A0A5J4ZA68_PORPP|nr:hypothetical protein FVE85_7489 [Porphyridium purpureum]|eukprot:POR3981..scf295_1